MSTSTSTEAATAVVADLVDRILVLQYPRLAESLVTEELTVTQLRILFVLARRHQAIATHEVAEAVRLSLPATGRAVDRLVCAGLADRKEDEHDRRVKLVALTAAGIDLLRERFQLESQELRELLSILPGAVRDRLTAAVSEALTYLPEVPRLQVLND